MKTDIEKITGRHKLTGISRSKYAEGYVLEIDGKKYVVYEDDDDEYRSRCAIEEVDEENMYCKEEVNHIPSQDIDIVFDGKSFDSEFKYGITIEAMSIFNHETQAQIFVAVTMDWDDYYPYVYFEYKPENLSVNNK